MTKRDTFQPVDDAARALASRLLSTSTFAAFAVLQDGAPVVTRIALAITPDGAPLSLISDLSTHTAALEANPACSLLIGEPAEKGDPLTHPRLTLQTTARFIARDSTEHPVLRKHYLQQRPKAQLYIDFTDFRLVTFEVHTGLLNGGFGRASKFGTSDFR